MRKMFLALITLTLTSCVKAEFKEQMAWSDHISNFPYKLAYKGYSVEQVKQIMRYEDRYFQENYCRIKLPESYGKGFSFETAAPKMDPAVLKAESIAFIDEDIKLGEAYKKGYVKWMCSSAKQFGKFG